MSNENNQEHNHQGPFYVVCRSVVPEGDYAAGTGWGKYANLHGPGGAIERRDNLRSTGADAIVTVEL